MSRGLRPGETPFTRKSCYDCSNLKSALSLWCGSEEAIKARGTRIPGCIHCPYWKPDWNYIDDEYKTPENGYITIRQKVRNGAKSFQIELDKNWFGNDEEKLVVVSKPKCPWYQTLVKWFTFGYIKPTRWSYKVKRNEKTLNSSSTTYLEICSSGFGEKYGRNEC